MNDGLNARQRQRRPLPTDLLWPYTSALVVVAHPDDEILWAGGTILMHPETQWTVFSLCRGSDPDRAPRFHRVMEILGSSGEMADLDDGPGQRILQRAEIEDAVLGLADGIEPDLILTHSVCGEYSRHRRHEEIGAAVLALWDAGRLRRNELWSFAYSDTGAGHAVHAIREADVYEVLTEDIWERKRCLVSEVYGFAPESFEARAALREEAFWRLRPTLIRETRE